MSFTTHAPDMVVALLLATAIGAGCARSEPHREVEHSAPPGSAPTPSAKSQPPRATSADLAPGPPTASISKEDRERTVIELLSGGAGMSELPVVDRDPGRQWNPSLRDRLAPVVATVPRVRMGKMQIDGAMPAELVTRVLRTRYGTFRLCYAQGLSRDEELAGTVAVTFAVGPDGKVKEPRFDGATTLSDRDVVRCVLRYLSTTRFPATDHGRVTVNASLDFAPPSSIAAVATEPH